MVEDFLRAAKMFGHLTRAVTVTVMSDKTKDGWELRIIDRTSGRSWHRYFWYRADATELRGKLVGKTVEEIFDIYGGNYFTERK